MYQLGSRSLANLQGVHPRLVQVVKLAITLTAQDYTVLEGVRSLAAQKVNVAKGASQTMDSKHLRQADGFGHAVDLAAWAGGKVVWDPWERYDVIADAMRRAAIQLGVQIRWGGGWFNLNQLASPAQIVAAREAYTAGRKRARRKAFLDGPHFELQAAAR